MQKATSAITISNLFSPIFEYISKANHTSITPRSKFHGTLQINQSNFLISNPAFVRVYEES